jgi:tetratricopeptide (TPR) repeat protein
MANPRFYCSLVVAVIPICVPLSVRAQSPNGTPSSDSERRGPGSGAVVEPGLRKMPKRGRSGIQLPEGWATNDWNPTYLKGKEYFIDGRYGDALIELEHNVKDCERIDFDVMRRQNAYFEHICKCIPGMGQSPHEFIRASNLQWVGAALAALGSYDEAEARFTEMGNYAEKCFPGRLSTFAGCAAQGLAFLLAARGRYDEASERYRLALTHIEDNQSQVGLPPAPCVSMILAALADVELSRGRLSSAERFIARCSHVQETQHRLGIGAAPLDRAARLLVLAQLRQCQRRDSEAYDLFVDALATIRGIRQDHPLAAYCLDGLGEIDLVRGRLGQSEEHFRESLSLREGALGRGHRDVAYSLDGLGRVATAQAKNDDAAEFLRQALWILTRALGPSHPDTAAVAAHARRRADPPRADKGTNRIRPRFLAIPTFITVGWQVLNMGTDWRVTERSIRQRDAKAAKAIRRASAPSRSTGSGQDGADERR